MRMREAEREDASAIARFIAMAESEAVRLFTGVDEPEQSAKLVEALILSPVPCRYSFRNTLIAEIGGAAAGMAISFAADSQPGLDGPLLELMRGRGLDVRELFFEGDPGTWYLSTLGVDPAFRGMGAGTALMAASERRGVEQGFDRATLLVSKDKKKAKALYERLGYATLCEVTIYHTSYFRMGKQISGQSLG